MLNLFLVNYLFKIAHLFNTTVVSHEEKSFCEWIVVNRCYCDVELLPDSVSTLLFSTAVCSSVSFLPGDGFFYRPRLKCNNGAACMICGLLPGNVLLLMLIPIKVRLRRQGLDLLSLSRVQQRCVHICSVLRGCDTGVTG